MLNKTELADAIQAIDSMISRSRAAQAKFARGTSHYTLQENRIAALEVASTLVEQELAGQAQTDTFIQEDLGRVHVPIRSLLSKSEKSQRKLAEGSWHYTMLEENIKALRIALLLLESRE